MAAVPTVPTSGPAAGARGRRRRMTAERGVFLALFLGLPLLVYVLFVVSPFVQAFYYSLTDWRGVSAHQEFIGLANYAQLFSDPFFLKALWHNLALAVVLPVITISLAFALAILVTIGGDSRGQIRGISGANIYRVVSFFPYVIPAVVVGILFGFVYRSQGGLLNGILNLPGSAINGLAAFFGADETLIPLIQTDWLGSRTLAMPAIVFAVVWSLVGFYMVLFVAAIRSVPAEVLEAARLDGCGRFRLAVQIVLPMLRENVSTALVYMGIMALDMFVYVSIMTPNGGTGKSTEVIGRYLYETAFQKSNFGLASAMGVVLALITMLMAVLVLFGSRRKGE